MSVAKIIEISAESKDGFDAAVAEGIKRAGKTVNDIKGAWIKEYEVTVDNGAVAVHRVKMKVTFLVG